ncbi:MAG: hypothetical protein KKF44_10365 [Nanoarchaeota archaeon]|nr:hypothetical protein [Nanoarchaeota archaeon]
MSYLKDMLKSGKIIVYLIFFVLMLMAINPNPWNEGVTIRNVLTNSSAYTEGGIRSASPRTPPMSRERIVTINDIPIESEQQYYEVIDALEPDQNVFIDTEIQKSFFFSHKNSYAFTVKPITRTIELNETETVKTTYEEFDEDLNQTVNKTKYRTEKKTAEEIIGVEDFGIRVYNAPTTNIKLGLDLQGGTRVVLQPAEKISAQDMETVIENMKQRLNVYGLSDLVIRSSGDLSGNQFIVAEIAGANEEEVSDLLAKQGKFEAKIANETVFLGGQDITYVCRSAQCSGIDPQYGCNAYPEGTSCRFRFSISLSTPAAERQASLTGKLDVIYEPNGQEYLSQDLELYLDDALVDTLRIGSDLKGQASTDISISGSGFGGNEIDARNDALKNMKRLQTILITGSLPVKLNIIKTDAISPSLGKEFLSNAVLIGLLAMLGVTLVVYLRYRKIKIAVPIITIITSEILLILGVSALLGQNIDIAGIAGIIVAIGTGVDDQIVITDETLRKEKEVYSNLKMKIKKAFFIVIAAYVATIASMTPLVFAGAGLLRGFAITTIIGVTNGVLITRPAFSKMIEILLKDELED